jgi:glucose/arabinose dehydrogenase
MRQPISAIAPAGGGRVYFVEGGHYIRVVAGAELLADPALAVDRATDRLIALAVDASFATTRLVWAAWLDESAPRARTLSVARFRDVNNRLGQRAIVVADLPVPASGDPKVAWDEGGQIFIAMPASSPDERRDPYDGSILRLAPDGSVPAGSGQRSPVLMQGFDRPTAMAADPVTHQVWVVAGETGRISRMASSSSVASVSAQVVAVRDAAVVSVAPSRDPDGPLYVVDAAGGLSVISRATAGAEPERIQLVDSEVVEVASGRDGLYAVLSSGSSPLRWFALVMLTQR